MKGLCLGPYLSGLTPDPLERVSLCDEGSKETKEEIVRSATSTRAGRGIAKAIVCLVVTFVVGRQATAGPVVREAAGVNPAAIQGAVDLFRTDLGGANNGTTPGRQPSPEFGDLNGGYSNLFGTFSAPRLTALNSNVTDVRFTVPGDIGVPAAVTGFGAVFTDVDSATSTKMDVLPSIQVPTLVLHRRGDRCLSVEEGRYLASRIPTAMFVELPGDDHLPFVGNQDDILNEIDRFLAQRPPAPASEYVLATVLTVASDASAADREHVRRVFVQEVGAHRGRIVEADSTRLTAIFEGPGRAVRCGRSVTVIGARSQIVLRAGVHIGECDPTARAGPLLDICSEIADAALPGEVLVSRTIVDLVAGSGLQFADRGMIRVEGVKRDLAVLSVTHP